MDNVMVARKHQADAYKDFMNDKDHPTSKDKYKEVRYKEFRYKAAASRAGAAEKAEKAEEKGKDDDADIVFKIVTFDTTGLTLKYPSFCTLVNEYGERHALSNDKNALVAFHSFRQRLLSAAY